MAVLGKTLGALLIGVLFNTFLYGLVICQFATYYQTRLNDRTVIKYMVFFLFVLDTFHSCSLIYMMWHYAVNYVGNPVTLEVAIWPHTFTPLGASLAAFITQIYLGFNIWRLTKSKTLYGVAIILAISSLVFGALVSIDAFIIKVISKFSRFVYPMFAWLITEVIVDSYNTTTLIILYSRMRTGFQKTDSILNRLIRGAIQTGLFASIFSIANLICALLFLDTDLYVMFCISLGRIYTNTLLDNLLTRKSIRAEIGDERTEGMSMVLLTTRIPVGQLESC